MVATATSKSERIPTRLAHVKAADLRDPVGFAKGALGHSIWGMQAKILRSVQNNRRTAVKSCHASGKTFISADAALWWITTHPDGICVTTAPTWTQVEELLWGEIRNSTATARVKYPEVTKTKLDLGPKNFAIGISTNEANRFSGFHGGHVLIILDEAPGVRQEVWEGIQGLRSGGDVRLLAIGNPVIVGGTFYDAFTGSRAGWSTYTITAFDTPNLHHVSLSFKDAAGVDQFYGADRRDPDLMTLTEEELDQSVRPYLCTRRWVREMFEEWGPEHPYFQSRVLGNFPTQGDDALISLAWLEQAKTRNAPADYLKEPVRGGLDVAGPGEAETVLALRRGAHLIHLQAWPQADPRGAVLAALAPYKNELEALNVDSAGIGYYMSRHLKDNGVPAVEVNVGTSPSNMEKYANLKAELYWGLRMRVQSGDFSGLQDEKAIGQLVTVRYEHDARGRVKIESKEDAMKRGVKSPDRAEAIMLAYGRPLLANQGIMDLYAREADQKVNDAAAPPQLVVSPTADTRPQPRALPSRPWNMR